VRSNTEISLWENSSFTNFPLLPLYQIIDKWSHNRLIDGLTNNGYDRSSKVRKIFPNICLPQNSSDIDNFLPHRKFNAEIIFRSTDLFVSNVLKRKIDLSCFAEAKASIDCAMREIEDTKINFSSAPLDIATMSMRGLHSCMAWKSDQSKTLAGSIIDPFCAILYLDTDQTTRYGSRMVARCIVRLVWSTLLGESKAYSLFLERPYLNSALMEHPSNSYIIQDIFANYLGKKSKLKIYNKETAPSYSYIPTCKEVIDLDSRFLSYRDSKIEYLGFIPSRKIEL
jgi:hypothetical protein